MNDPQHLKDTIALSGQYPSPFFRWPRRDHPLRNTLLSHSVLLGRSYFLSVAEPGPQPQPGHRAFPLPDPEWALGQAVAARPSPGAFAANA